MNLRTATTTIMVASAGFIGRTKDKDKCGDGANFFFS